MQRWFRSLVILSSVVMGLGLAIYFYINLWISRSHQWRVILDYNAAGEAALEIWLVFPVLLVVMTTAVLWAWRRFREDCRHSDDHPRRRVEGLPQAAHRPPSAPSS